MTADMPLDYPYEPVKREVDAESRRAYWNVAMGLQRVDGLEPSSYLRELADGYVQGRYTLMQTGKIIRERYQDVESAESVSTSEREADLVS